MKTTKSDIGRRIRITRDRLDLTGAELGTILNVGKQAISNYETGLAYPSPDSIAKIAELGKVTIDWLVTGKEPVNLPQTTINEVSPSYTSGFDEETVATVMGLLDQLEDFFGEKLPAQKKAKIFINIYADKIAGKPIRLTDFGDLLKEQG
jgi:transcriptional regulator with XRE-family HTH domain